MDYSERHKTILKRGEHAMLHTDTTGNKQNPGLVRHNDNPRLLMLLKLL